MKAALLSLTLLVLPGGASAEAVWVGRFASPDGRLPEPWKIEPIDPKLAATVYRLRHWDGVAAVEARAENSMALLARRLDIDLGRTPVLCWSWRVEAPVAGADLYRRSGDDYAARVYLMFSVAPQHLGLATRGRLALARAIWGKAVPDAAINYVWDNQNPPGTEVANAYTDRAMMSVLRSGSAEARRWQSERRDVGADFERLFGHPPQRLEALAVASDTDNTHGSALAGFADFRFVGRHQDCPPP